MPGRGASAGSVALLVILVLLAVLGGEDDDPGDAAGQSSGEVREAQVLRVVDGDTIEVDIDGTEEDLRYIGVDTPETVKPGSPVECFGPQASDRNHELVEGRSVRLEFDRELRDDYGRLLAYVYVGKRFINGELVAGGFARTLEIEPNTARAGLLNRLEAEAGSAGRGLWAAC